MDKHSEGHPQWIRINELSRTTGVSRYTIHYYLKEDLLPPPLKTGRTMALYSDVHADCLRFIKGVQKKRGMSVAAIRAQVRNRFAGRWNSAASAEAPALGMDPRRGPKGNRQRQRIIETAVEFFSRQGYHRTHVSHIADTLHISKGTFYQYFKDKHDLFVAVFDHLISSLTSVEEEIAEETDFVARMQARGRSYFSYYQKYHKIIDIIRAESIGLKPDSKVNVHAIYQKMLDPLCKDLREAQAKGLIPETIAPEMHMDMLFGAFDFMCYRIFMGHYSWEEIRGTLQSIFFGR